MLNEQEKFEGLIIELQTETNPRKIRKIEDALRLLPRMGRHKLDCNCVWCKHTRAPEAQKSAPFSIRLPRYLKEALMAIEKGEVEAALANLVEERAKKL